MTPLTKFRQKHFQQIIEFTNFDSLKFQKQNSFFQISSAIDIQGHYILSSLITNRTVCTKIYNKQRSKINLSRFVQLVTKKGQGFKSWPENAILFCKCGSTLHNSETCPLCRTRLTELRILKKFDKDMYEFLSTIPEIRSTTTPTSI